MIGLIGEERDGRTGKGENFIDSDATLKGNLDEKPTNPAIVLNLYG